MRQVKVPPTRACIDWLMPRTTCKPSALLKQAALASSAVSAAVATNAQMIAALTIALTGAWWNRRGASPHMSLTNARRGRGDSLPLAANSPGVPPDAQRFVEVSRQGLCFLK